MYEWGRDMFAWVRWLDAFFERIRFRYLGLGLLVAWVYCSWFSEGIFPANEGDAASSTLRASLLFSAAGLFVLVFRPGKQTSLDSRLVFGASVVVSSTTMLFFVLPDGLPLLAAGALGGIASAALWVAWGEFFCRIDQDDAESCIPASLGAFVAATLAVYLLPFPFSGILAALLPVVSCLMLLLGESALPSNCSFPAARDPFAKVLPALLKLALCSMVCSVATGFVATSSIGALSIAVDDYILFYAAGGMVAGIMSMVAIAHTNRMNFSFLYEWAIPLIVFSLSARAVGGEFFGTAAMVLACSAALYVEVLFYALFVRITAKQFCLPSETFGIFRSFVQLGFLFGGLLSSWVLSMGADIAQTCLFLICACVVMLPLFIHLQTHFDAPMEEVDVLRLSEECGCRRGDAVAEALFDISEQYKLSAREKEILGYLGRGRSVPYMREAMTISKSTIETHIKHIYAKTGVHSKQELLDLIESFQNRGA